MRYSLSEINAMAKKAARGAGFEWGYAEEIGDAVKWLASHNLAGVMELAEYFSLRDQSELAFTAPQSLSDQLSSPNDAALCPVLTGAFLMDHAPLLPDHIQLQQVASPLLLVPCFSALSRNKQQNWLIEWEGFSFYCAPSGIQVSGELTLRGQIVESMSCRVVDVDSSAFSHQKATSKVYASAWATLADFAAKTYVPATEQSRQGAGPT